MKPSAAASARALYESLGFTVYGREPRALKNGDTYLDDDLMILFLRQAGPEKTD